MDDALVSRLLLIFFGACIVGPALGALWGWWKGFTSGVALGCLIIGLAGLTGAAWAALDIHRTLAGSEMVEGVLVEFAERPYRDVDDELTVERVPIVEYMAADGRTRRVEGLSGSQGRAEPGEAVTVRYPATDPDRAVIADAQNMYGVVIALGIFGLFPTLFGTFFVMEARSERRPQKVLPAPLPPSPWRTPMTVVANVVFLGGFAVCALGEDLARSTGAGFMTVGAGALLHFVAQSLPPARMAFRNRFIFVIVGLGFAVFGGVLWVLAG